MLKEQSGFGNGGPKAFSIIYGQQAHIYLKKNRFERVKFQLRNPLFSYFHKYSFKMTKMTNISFIGDTDYLKSKNSIDFIKAACRYTSVRNINKQKDTDGISL